MTNWPDYDGILFRVAFNFKQLKKCSFINGSALEIDTHILLKSFAATWEDRRADWINEATDAEKVAANAMRWLLQLAPVFIESEGREERLKINQEGDLKPYHYLETEEGPRTHYLANKLLALFTGLHILLEHYQEIDFNQAPTPHYDPNIYIAYDSDEILYTLGILNVSEYQNCLDFALIENLAMFFNSYFIKKISPNYKKGLLDLILKSTT